MIRAASTADASSICAIYNHYVTDTIVTFEEQPVTTTEMRSRMDTVLEKLPWLVLEHDGAIAGYAYASPWKSRSGYRFTVESSIYLSPTQVGRGFGSALYQSLLEDLRARNIHCVIGGAALPNVASAALHEKLGFTKVAHFRENGFKFGHWIDVGYWQILF
ncbi:MAG: GNAT family N-acetyltransferase [Xanthomonadaceae bacterium]|nr:GNAT family N-acetyltransferase [Xanthomonadaceae bacterium]MBU6477354.1 GNAT family N-acetyltransferase [Xanthomonadaceae bacterium]MDE2054076.1 N-acetyltransferase [Xanthomonadaceae bacterium]MDE2225481.1 N-acetyltransferase [Xanthomonadaceae bacterium]